MWISNNKLIALFREITNNNKKKIGWVTDDSIYFLNQTPQSYGMDGYKDGQYYYYFFIYIFQTPEELEDDSDFEQEDYDARSRTSVQTEDDQLIAGQSARVSDFYVTHEQHLWFLLSFPSGLRSQYKTLITPLSVSAVNYI